MGNITHTYVVKKKKTHKGTHTLEGTKKQEDTLVFFFPSHLPIHPWFCL